MKLLPTAVFKNVVLNLIFQPHFFNISQLSKNYVFIYSITRKVKVVY